MTQIYGISQCDTVRKARAWLAKHNIEAAFIDFKQHPPSAALLHQWLQTLPLSTLLNRNSTTWRKLSADEQHSATTTEGAIALMQTHPSLIKRPVLVQAEHTEVGFDAQRYATLFAQEPMP